MDEKLGRFKDKPLKDWASDPADAFRYMSIGHREHKRLGYYSDEELMIERENEDDKGVLNPFA